MAVDAMAVHAELRAIPDMWLPFGHHECCYQRLGKFLVHSIRHISADQTTIQGAVNQKWEIGSRTLGARSQPRPWSADLRHDQVGEFDVVGPVLLGLGGALVGHVDTDQKAV